MNFNKIATALLLVVLLNGCQEFQGPVWSGDGKWIAYTVYEHQAGGGFHTRVYLSLPDAEDAPPELLADNAAFPQFTLNGATLFFLAERDDSGFYTKIMRVALGKGKPEVALAGVRLTGMQLATSNGNPLLLLKQGRDAKPGALVKAELWNSADKKRTDLQSLGDMSGPAISAGGRLIVYGSKPAEGHPILMAAEIGPTLEAKAIFPTATLSEPDAASYVVHPFPNGDRFLFYGPGLRNVWTLSGKPGANKFSKFPIPEGLSCPILAHVAGDANSAALTFVRATPGKLAYESYRLDLQQSRWSKLEQSPDEIIGGVALDPTVKKGEAARMAWLSAGGLTVGDAAKPAWYPVTASQVLGASALLLAAKQPEKAMEWALKAQDLNPPPDSDALNQTLYNAYVANKKFDRASDIFEQSWLLEPIGRAGVQFVFSPDSGLPPPTPEWIAIQLKCMNELIAGAPENRMIPLLKAALVARQTGKHREALDAYRKALDYCPDKARVAGVRFQQGICELEIGEAYQAGDMFEKAAHIEDFPQADLAAGMGAMAYMLFGKKETVAKASALMQLPVVQKSPYAPEFAGIAAMLKGKVFKEHGATPESISPDDSAHAWAEYDNFWMPWVSTQAVGMDRGDGTFVPRHIGVKRMTASSIYTNKQATPILRVARPVTAPKLSPAGSALAFTVNGEIMPVGENFCELIVLDLAGGVFNGNTPAATAGRTKGRQILTAFAWKGDTGLTLTGVDVDLYGAQKPFEKTVPLGRLTAKRP